MKNDNIDEGVFSSGAKLATSTIKSADSIRKAAGRSTSAAMLNASSKLDSGTQARDDNTVQQNKSDIQNKFNYLKYTFYMIRYLQQASGESIHDKLKDQNVYKTYTYLNKLQPFIEKTTAGKNHWKKLFQAVDSPDSTGDLINAYNVCVRSADIKGIPEYKNSSKSVIDQWLDIAADYDMLKKYADGGDKTAKQLLSFFNLFPESNFVNSMSLSILNEEDEDLFKDDKFDKALAYIKAYKNNEGAVGRILAAMKDDERFSSSFKKRINKFYNKYKDDEEKKDKMASAGLGLKSEPKPEPKPEPKQDDKEDKNDDGDISADSPKTTEQKSSQNGEEYNLKLNRTQFVNGMKKMSQNPGKFKLVNKEVLDATPGSSSYLSWDEFKKILDYIQDPEGFEEKTKNRSPGMDALGKTESDK